MFQIMIVWLGVFLSGSFALAQSPVRVMSGYAATSGPHAVLWIARDAGLFEKNGLRTEVANIRSGSTMAQTLVSGEIQMSQMGGPALLAAGVAGMDVTFVAVALNTTPIVIMGTVSRMEDLKGKGVGVTRYGSNTDISARFAIRKAGLQPEKDVALIQLEDYPGIMGGIASGRIAAGALADPFTDAAKKWATKKSPIWRPWVWNFPSSASPPRNRILRITWTRCSALCAPTRKPSRFIKIIASWR